MGGSSRGLRFASRPGCLRGFLGAWLLLGGSVARGQESLLDAARASARGAVSDPRAQVAYGRALRRAGHEAEALVALRKASALAPAGPVGIDARWELARTAIAQRSFQAAMGYCRSVGALTGGESAAHACAAEAHLLWKRGSEALGETAQALALDPRQYEARVAEGEAKELAVDDAGAELSLREAIGVQGDRWEAHLALGRSLVRRGEAAAGLEELRRAVALDPSGPEAPYALAVSLPRGPEALGLLERAVRERPLFPEALRQLASMNLAMGRLPEARAAAERALAAEPKNASSQVVLGTVALAEQRPDEAIREGQAALSILANSSPAKLLVADAYAAKGEIDLAVENYQAAYGLDHDDPTPLVHAAAACLAAGRSTSAKAFGERVTHDFPRLGGGWVSLGDALASYGDPKGARAAYATALKYPEGVDLGAVQRKVAALR